MMALLLSGPVIAQESTTADLAVEVRRMADANYPEGE